MDKYYAVFIEETQLSRLVAKDLILRARNSVGGEGELQLTQVNEGGYCVLFGNENHRDAFEVSLRRRSVKYVLRVIDASKVNKPKAEKTTPRAKPEQTSNPTNGSLTDILIRMMESLAEELRKK